MTVAVALGTFGQPRLTELQIRLLRATNSPMVPILVCDDASPAADALERLEDQYDDVTTWVSPYRRGHYAGDLSVLWKAAQWGATRGFECVVKLSQRCLVDRPGWLAEVATLLKDEQAAVASQECLDHGVNMHLRSEIMGVSVPEWSAADVVAQLNVWQLGVPTEHYLGSLLTARFGNRLARVPWLAVDRYQKSEGVVCHTTDSVEAYQAIADRYGLTLDDGFHVETHDRRPNWKVG